MQLHEQSHNGIAVIRIIGKIFENEAVDFRMHVSKTIDQEGLRGMIINLEQVPSIDSSALGAIVGAYKRLIQKNLDFVVCAMNKHLHEMFVRTRLDKVIQLCESEEEALKRFESH